MEVKAIARHVRLSPTKARLVMNLIRGRDAGEALKILSHAKQKAATPIRKVLESAIANAEHNYDMDADALVVSEARVDAGRSLRRLNPRARGLADIIRHPTCHLTVVVSDGEDEGSGKGGA